MGKGKNKKSMITILDKEFARNSIAVGAKLLLLGLLPDLNECPYFEKNFKEKIYRNVDHLFDHKEETINNHPYHHLFIAETLMKLGYAVFREQFDNNFSDELGFYRTVFRDYMNLHPDMYEKYNDFKQKESLDEKIRVLQTHDIKGYLRVKKKYMHQLKDAVEEVSLYSQKNRKEIKNRFEKQKYDNIMALKDDFYQITALFKGVFNGNNFSSLSKL